jgi:hypothetical protein
MAVRRKRATGGQMDMLQALLGPTDSPLVGAARSERTLMVWSFFALSKEHTTELPVYDDGRVRIEVVGTKHGVATMLDKDVLVYAIGLLQDRVARGEAPSRTVSFRAADFFVRTGRTVCGTAYDWLEQSLDRLKGTVVKTNMEVGDDESQQDGGGSERTGRRRGRTKGFSWISDYEFGYVTEGSDGEKQISSIVVELHEWVYKLLTNNGKILDYSNGYFDLSLLGRRLYELARAHATAQAPSFRINLERLRLLAGSSAELKEFRRMLQKTAGQNGLPLIDYGYQVIDPAAETARAVGAEKKGRTPLKAYEVVFFHKSVRDAALASPLDVPPLPSGSVAASSMTVGG